VALPLDVQAICVDRDIVSPKMLNHPPATDKVKLFVASPSVGANVPVVMAVFVFEVNT
jgi:hypothetical protein